MTGGDDGVAEQAELADTVSALSISDVEKGGEGSNATGDAGGGVAGVSGVVVGGGGITSEQMDALQKLVRVMHATLMPMLYQCLVVRTPGINLAHLRKFAHLCLEMPQMDEFNPAILLYAPLPCQCIYIRACIQTRVYTHTPTHIHTCIL
jgi:hypothetical protein